MKDIFLDTNAAKNLVNPLNDSFKELIKWLFKEGTLVTNQKLITEYIAGNQTLGAVLNKLQITGRHCKIENVKLNSFKFSKQEEQRFKSNYKDRAHLKTVFLSHRKKAISLDNNFLKDINSYRIIDGVKPSCVNCPSKMIYK